MPKLIMLLCYIAHLALPLHAENDSVRIIDSLQIITDTVRSDSKDADSDSVQSDSLLNDSLSESEGDTVLPTLSEARNDSITDTVLSEDYTLVPGDETLTPEPLEIPKRSLTDTIAAPKKAVKNFLRNVSGGVRWILRYIKHFLLLLISVLIVSYTLFYYRKKIDSKRFMTSTRLSVMDREIQLACKYIENHFHESDLSLETICEALVTGPAFLEALFEHELGMKVSDFIAHVRINRATIQATKQPDIDEEELLTHIGMTDRTMFIAKFKEITGTSYEDFKASLTDSNS